MENSKWADNCASPGESYQRTTSGHARKKKTTLYIGQPGNIFCRGARFDGVSKLHIHPPPPGCVPNELQTMLMKNEGEVCFAPAHKRLKEPGKFPIKSNNKITPNITVVAAIPLAQTSYNSTNNTSEQLPHTDSTVDTT